jgi:hypothetical protein
VAAGVRLTAAERPSSGEQAPVEHQKTAAAKNVTTANFARSGVLRRLVNPVSVYSSFRWRTDATNESPKDAKRETVSEFVPLDLE